MNKIYFPVSCRILTPGHIQCLKYLKKRGKVVVGLLTKNAMKGYKSEGMSFKDREYVLKTVAQALGGIRIVAQNNLNPLWNVNKYKCNALASGDGFELGEEQAIKLMKLKRIDIKLKGERSKSYSSSAVAKSMV